MLTERRPLQWPHLTVTVFNKQLHGTLTWISYTTWKEIKNTGKKKKKKIRPERESIDWATNKEQNCTMIYQQNGGAVTALNIANLLGKIKEMVEGRHFDENEMGGTLGFWVYV